MTRPDRKTTSEQIARYSHIFADRTKVMRSSAMRDLMAITEQSSVISLAGGLPDTATFAPEHFDRLMHSIAEEACAAALQYGPTEGSTQVKEAIATVMAAENNRVDPDSLIVTTGGQQVIDLVCKTLIDPGDTVIAEAPTYPGAVPVFCSYQAEVVQIDVDDDGLPTDLLRETIERLERAGKKPKLIYTIPNFQNPGGVTLSLKRRQQLVEIAAEHEILVLEDNPYGMLRFEGQALPTLYSLDGGEYVIYLGTFSKILSPGLRVGWAAAARPILEKLNLGKQAADLCSSSLTQQFVARYVMEGNGWRDYVSKLTTVYRQRRDAMVSALTQYLPDAASWRVPSGGIFLWVTLPDYLDTTDLLARALRENVAFVPGRAAYLDGRGGSSLRLNFSGVDEQTIEEGVLRIGKVIDRQIRLYEALIGGRNPGVTGKTKRTIYQQRRLAKVLRLPLTDKNIGRAGSGSERQRLDA